MAELEKEVMVDGRPVKFRSTAATPRIYRNMYGRDIYADFNILTQDVNENGSQNGASSINPESLTIFENLAYCMASQADPEIPDIDEWLDGFSMFSIYQVLPEIMELWGLNTRTMSSPKKKQGQRPGK